MRIKFFLAGACAALLCACGGGGLRPAKDGAAVAMQRQSFKLLKTPDPEFEAELEGILSASYETVTKAHADGTGFFAYSLSPKGAAYPLSEIEVSCLVQEGGPRLAGKRLCAEFFGELELRIGKALAARQQE
ncbi:MAG: hypothetical protein A2179_03540 [Elusimicrobia bacterium GWC2_63_65]|nr:MAG: hypothetical protein A2179_03540 [Elusimicrobia bacterium GWC2_63_65]